MKRLLTTTALVAFAALPVAAQTADAPQTGSTAQTGQAQSTDHSGRSQGPMVPGESFHASDLLGKRILMQQQGSAQAGGQTDMQGARTSAPPTGTARSISPGVSPGVSPGAQSDPLTGPQTGQVTDPSVGGTGVTRPRQPQSMAGGSMRAQGRDGMRMVGVISDVILNAGGDAVALIVDAGGYLGTAANEIRIPLEDVRFVIDPHADRQPADIQDRLPVGDTFTVVYTGNPETFRESAPYDETRATEAGEMRGAAQWDDAGQGGQQDVPVSQITTEDLLGAAVYGTGNEWIAEISELVLGEDAEIQSVIIDVGGFLSMETKLVALPMDEVRVRIEQRPRTRAYATDDLRVYVPYTEEQLEAMDRWDNNSDL